MPRVSPLPGFYPIRKVRSFLMRFPAHRAFCFALLLGVWLSATAFAQTAQKPGTGVITGRITLSSKPVANIGVVVLSSERGIERSAVARATTDYEGRYRLTNVPAGRYSVMAIAPAMVGESEDTYGEAGKMVTIAEGETVEKIDFSLVKGGVITGRVTDADGAPVIGERIHLNQSGNQNQNRWRGFSNLNPFMYETDDRGIYRIYGIAPGRYTVSIGESSEAGSVRFGFGGRGYYTRTFHPDATEEAKATVIEIGEGSEATNVDITVGRKAKSYMASGRVVDENGKPVVGVRVGNGALMADGRRMGGFGWGTVTDAKGEFRLDGLMPGRYAAFVWTEGNTQMDSYSDMVSFEITEGNISGLEVKLHRGSSISGTVVIEGTSDRAVLAKLSQLTLAAGVEGEGVMVPNYANVKIAPDGSFRITGLRPGKARIYLATYPPIPGFALARIEREGITQREIEVTPGSQITGVRVVIEFGSGSVRGLVRVENGTLPEKARLFVSARRRGGDTTGPANRGAQVDARGRFLIEGLPTGDYDLILQAIIPEAPARRIAPVKQSVTVANGVETETTMTLDLNARPPEVRDNE
jgi:protocatechuate 3,4-dioxygenase beta subunit